MKFVVKKLVRRRWFGEYLSQFQLNIHKLHPESNIPQKITLEFYRYTFVPSKTDCNIDQKNKNAQ